MTEEQLDFFDKLVADTSKDDTDVYVEFITRYGVDNEAFEELLDKLDPFRK